MLRESEVKVGTDLKGEKTTSADPIKKFAESFITVRSASIIYNKNKENLEVYKEIYSQDQGENERIILKIG